MPSTPETAHISAVMITTPDIKTAESLATLLVENHLAACVNIIPGLLSIYKWEGKLNKDSECLLIAKTASSNLEELVNAVKANHPYTQPEIIAWEIDGGSPAYLEWVISSSQPKVNTLL
jgi:periplasmic divalent cation tolerance protein